MKLDAKDDPRAVNEIAEIKTCNSSLFLEARKRSDLYMWGSKTPNGPSVKFLVSNVNTMDELRLTGNAMMGSRPLLSFDRIFDCQPHYQLLRAILTDIFSTPRGHPKSKPFIDRVMSFHVTDGRIWVRNFQVLDVMAGARTDNRGNRAGVETAQLIEIGPRFVLTPIRIFAGSFGGATLFLNPTYLSPNVARSQGKRVRGTKYTSRRESESIKKARDSKPSSGNLQLHDTFR
jgi:ribosome biogenesis protein BRX1